MLQSLSLWALRLPMGRARSSSLEVPWRRPSCLLRVGRFGNPLKRCLPSRGPYLQTLSGPRGWRDAHIPEAEQGGACGNSEQDFHLERLDHGTQVLKANEPCSLSKTHASIAKNQKVHRTKCLLFPWCVCVFLLLLFFVKKQPCAAVSVQRVRTQNKYMIGNSGRFTVSQAQVVDGTGALLCSPEHQ